MALDSASKRSSAINVGSPWRGLLPIPDGAIGEGDRAQAAYLYAGLVSAEPTPGAPAPSVISRGGSGGGGPSRPATPYEWRRSPYERKPLNEPEEPKRQPKFKLEFNKERVKPKHVKDPDLALIDEDLAMIDELRMD